MSYNNNNRPSISTNGVTFFEASGNILKVGYLNESISIDLWPASEDNGHKVYPKDNREKIVLTKERAQGLYSIIMDKLIPAYKNGTTYNGGVFINSSKTSVLEVRTEGGKCYVLYHTEIDENRIPKHTTVFTFNKTPTIENFNSKTGDFGIEEVDADFYLFVKALEGFVMNIGGSSAHANRFFDNYKREINTGFLSNIAAKIGASAPGNYGSYQNSGSQWNSQNSQDNSGGDVNINNVDDLNNILPH